MPPTPLSISPLTAFPNGEYGIDINGKPFGRISANPKAAFVIGKGKDVVVLENGTHLFDYDGRKLKIVVKDLEKRFVHEEYHPRKQKDDLKEARATNEEARKELMERVVVTEAQ